MSININKLNKVKTYCEINEEKYREYILNSIYNPLKRKEWDKSFCNDPDTTHNDFNSVFYRMIVKFLNIKDKKWRYSFIVEENKDWIRGYIQAYDENNKPILKLRSDQFGFSRPKARTWGKKRNIKSKEKYKYPYTKYLIDQSKDHNNITEDINIIIKIIKNTRSIGGSFLWPIISQKGRLESIYNQKRGVGGYIDDRVDLTLFEIKKYYKLLESGYNLKDIRKIMNNEKYLLMKYEDYNDIHIWLSHFEKFKEYVNFFCFNSDIDNSFVIADSNDEDEYQVINLITKSPITKRITKERIYNMDSKNIEIMLTNLNQFVVNRSNKIENILKKSIKSKTISEWIIKK